MRKGISAACLLSALAAGAISTFVSPVTADKAAVITISVNRATKGDRQPLALPIVRPGRHDSSSTGNPTLKRALPGCERAFSSLVEPKRADILTYCTT
jgi:hypothetical protein